jgi:uncharacterized membrane protein
MTHHVTRTRSLVKALTWRALGSLDTFVLGYIVTGRVGAAAGIASFEVFTKSALYYLHERGWDLVQWGHVEEPAPVFVDLNSTILG